MHTSAVQPTTTFDEHVILLDDAGNHIGTAPKSDVHTADTALHLAFSCYVFNAQGDVLVTRRALTKKAWPGVWTNSFCGHPLPDESSTSAIERRARFELGMEVSHVEMALPLFRYRATDSSGIVENEICPVYTAHANEEPEPNPEEVAEYAWTSPSDLHRALTSAPWAFSPWMALQVAQLDNFRA